MIFFRPISISLSPNTEKDDIFLAFKLLFQPWRWKKEKKESGSPLVELGKKFEKYLGIKYTIFFNSGRSALMAILDSLEFKKNDEILLQAFTCNAAVNPVIWTGLKPIFVDCDEKTFNIDIEDLKNKITSKSKALIVQHTFGLMADMDKVLEICEKNNLILIEDCAHSLGAEYNKKKAGTFGKVSFFSFSRDKVISSVYGGMVASNDEKLVEKLKKYEKNINYPSFFWIKQQLLHPLLMNYLILPTYLIFGKYFLIFLQWLKILSKAVHWKEKKGKKPDYFPKKMPNALAILTLNQFKKIEKFNNYRKEIATFYFNQLKKINSFELLPLEVEKRKHIFLRFTIKHFNAHKIIENAWKNNILIGDWYTSPIAPNDTKLDKLQYLLGSCPKAEKLAKEVLNLPTHINISKKEAQKIIEYLKKYGN